jgi:hypothetical protein
VSTHVSDNADPTPFANGEVVVNRGSDYVCLDHVSNHVSNHMYPTICVRPYVSDCVGQPPFVNIADCASDLSSFLCSLVSLN